MGLFISVDTNKKCPNCGADVCWQSKEAIDKNDNFIEPFCQHINLEDIQIGEIHTLCSNCNTWLEYKVKNGILKESEE